MSTTLIPAPEDDPTFETLQQIRQSMSLLLSIATGISRSLPVQRREPNDWCKGIHIKVTLLYRGGRCPNCESATVCTPEGRWINSEFDHFFARHKNGLHEVWLVCSACNRGLEDPEARTAAAVPFQAYQRVVRAYLGNAQAALF